MPFPPPTAPADQRSAISCARHGPTCSVPGCVAHRTASAPSWNRHGCALLSQRYSPRSAGSHTAATAVAPTSWCADRTGVICREHGRCDQAAGGGWSLRGGIPAPSRQAGGRLASGVACSRSRSGKSRAIPTTSLKQGACVLRAGTLGGATTESTEILATYRSLASES